MLWFRTLGCLFVKQPRAMTGGYNLSSSESNQAREGRLVDALAVRGDEGRVTLR